MKFRPALIGLVAAIIGAALLLLYMRRYETEMSGGDRVDVLVAVQRIERGSAISGAMLTSRAIPQAYVDDRAVRVSDREKILGMKAVDGVDVSQTLLWSSVVTLRDEQRDLSSLVQPGNRAVTAPFAASPALAMIRPGDFVDVVGVMSRPDSDSRQSVVLLQRVLVLAQGTDTGNDRTAEKAAGSRSPILTLSLNIREAQLLSLAGQRGALSIALRNPNDLRVAENISDLGTNAIFEPAARAEVRGYRRHETPVKLEATK